MMLPEALTGVAEAAQDTGHALLVAYPLQDGERASVVDDGLIAFFEVDVGSANFVQATGHCLLVANLLRDGERAGVVVDGLVIFPEALVGVAEVVQAADCTSKVATLTSSVNSSQDVLRLIDEGTTCRRLVVTLSLFGRVGACVRLGLIQTAFLSRLGLC